MHLRTRMTAVTLMTFALSFAAPAAAEMLPRDGDSIAFLGDSITAGGWGSPLGYVRLVVSGLEVNGVKVKPYPAGVGGHKSNDMLARLQRDVLDKKPTFMTLSCGVNDVWHGERGVALEPYKTNITAIVDKAQAAGIKVVILTSTLITEDVNAKLNQLAIPYNDFLRQLAKEKGCPLADLNADERAALAAIDEAVRKRGNQLTSDGVHMIPAGDMMMASGVLRALGLSDAQLAKAKEAWLDIPNAVTVGAQPRASLRQMRQLKSVSDKEGRGVETMVNEAVAGTISNLLQSAKQ